VAEDLSEHDHQTEVQVIAGDGPAATLLRLRGELRDLLGQLDTLELPKPDRLVGHWRELRTDPETPLGAHPGPLWEPAKGWGLRTADDDDEPRMVYVATPGHYGGDTYGVRSRDARRIGMAFLAAAAAAEADRP
jgi:hypothetical protein